jgi:CRISPR-associated endonuclease/helicase Cas3
MADSSLPFAKTFETLTGHRPFPWQERLFDDWFAKGEVPPSCNLPTGLGKTNVIAVWLIALANGAKVPRRLVYVVNRRTVVDQTTVEVERIRNRIKTAGLVDALRAACGLDENEPPLAISTLRGQFADNHEWSANPSRPAVICGTVDMIGSRLLFSGYGIGFKSRPLHAGFLGQDVLIVHDEAHLEPAFQKLIERICCEQRGGRCDANRRHCGFTAFRDFLPLRVMELSATTRNDDGDGVTTFTLQEEDRTHPIVKQRIEAVKRLQLHEAKDDAKIADEIAELALDRRWLNDEKGKIIKDENRNPKNANAAVLIFVRTLDDVKKVCSRLTDKKNGVPDDHIQQLTGTMRGLERDRMADPRWTDASRVFARFLQPPKPDAPEDEQWKIEPMPGTVYLVCTSAGEVGVNISGYHMVCDLSTFESMAQRLGRVNRFGDRGDTRIDVVYPTSFGKIDKKTGELKADEIDKRRQKTLELLRQLPSLGEDLHDASPKALGDLRHCSDLPCNLEDAFAPKPVIPQATNILFDGWAMTSITDNMPGRPEVAPYLHGIADDLPQTTIAWRAELDLLKDDPNRKAALRAIFAKHRIRPHESLTVRSCQAIEFLTRITSPKVRPELLETRVALIFTRGLELTTVKALIGNPAPLNADPTLVLPPSFGGLDDKGMLSADAIPSESNAEASSLASLDIADMEGYERQEDAKPRLRVLIERTDNGWTARPMPGAAPLLDGWNLEKPPERSTPLVNHIQKKSGLRARLVQPIKWNEEDDPVCALVCLSPPPKQQKPVEQTLDKHVGMVEEEVNRLARTLLGNDKVALAALRLAAKWHDEGKKTQCWQRYIGGPNDKGEPLGKSAEWCDPKQLCGYRHEFGSLLRSTPHLPDEEDVRELALHLIAAHHGYARPHFRHTLDRDFTTQESDQTHIDVIRRFARLQRKYGRWGLAYLESLLRAADRAASRTIGTDPEVDDDDASDIEGDEA